MNNIGIIAEYNPFHSGHQHHIQKSKNFLSQSQSSVVVIMSGHWVQQANCAILDKWTRTKLALEGGADLIIELPTLWATASAQRFAQGAVALLEATGLVTHLSFGSESGDISLFQELNQGLQHPDFKTKLKEELRPGCSFPTARQKALSHLVGIKAELLSKPNNTLGLEYLSAIDHYNSDISPFTIPREGAGFHDISPLAPQKHTSATDIRAKIMKNNWQDTHQFLSPFAQIQLQTKEIPSMCHCERAILSKLISMSLEDWTKLPDSGREEGLPQRCLKVAQTARSTEEFIANVKTKRYTHARIRRLVLWAFLGLTEEMIPEKPTYLRVLGMNQRGIELLHQMKATATLPICTKPAQIQNFSSECQDLFQKEVVFTDLYGLCFPSLPPRGLEWTQSPIVDLS